MEIIKRKSKKYPIKVILSDEKQLIIPKQSAFSDEWLKKHGCSLMAEYIALQWIGVEKIKIGRSTVGIYPINLLKWHKLHTKDQVKAKVTVKGVAQAIRKLAKGKGTASYYTTVTATKIRKAIDGGHPVIMEQADPIHTIILLPDKDGTFKASYGKVTKISIDSIARTATTNKTYRGMVVVREV